MAFATAVVYGGFVHLIGAALIGVAFWLKLRHEEVMMSRHFPDQYSSYRRRVRALIPFVL